MVTSRAAARSTRPVAPSMTPSTSTDPPRDDALSDPPLMPPVVTSLAASIVMAWLPETSAVPEAIVAAPPAAVMPMVPLLVAIELLTATSRPAVRATAPPAAPPRPSIGALTITSPPAVALNALPVRVLSTA